MPYDYNALNIRMIHQGGDATKFVPFARSRVFGLPDQATQFYQIENAKIQVIRRGRDAWVYITVATGSVFYEFFIPNFGESGNPTATGRFLGVEIIFDPREDKEIYKGTEAEVDNPDNEVVDLDITWTDNSWEGRDTHYVFYKYPTVDAITYRLVSSMLTHQPYHNPFSLFLKSPMTSPFLWPGRIFFNAGAVPSLYKQLESLGSYNLPSTNSTVRTAGMQTVTSDEFGTREYMIQSDQDGWFYAFPFNESVDAGIPAGALKIVRAPILSDVELQNNGLLAPFENVIWKFNSTGTRAVTTFIKTFDQFTGRTMVKVVANDGSVYLNVFDLNNLQPGASFQQLLPVNAVMPYLVELNLNIVITGENPEDFDFELTIEREYFPDDRFIYGADYAYEHPNLVAKGIQRDDLIVMVCEIYDRFENTEDTRNRQLVTVLQNPDPLAGATFSSLFGSEIVAVIHNLTTSQVIKEYPLHTACYYSSVLDIERDGDSLYSTTLDYLSRLDQQLVAEPESLMRGYIQAVDLRSCTVAIAYEQYVDRLDFSRVFQDGFTDNFRRYGIVNTHVDREIFFQSQGVVEVTDRPHEALVLNKLHKLKHTDDKFIFHQCAQAHFEQTEKGDIASHPQGHISFSKQPIISAFGPQTFDVIAIWNDIEGSFVILTHKDLYNLLFENNLDYDFYNGDYAGSFRTWGYFP